MGVASAKILVVDDFELNRDMLCRRLRSRGFEVVDAGSGLEAIEKIESWKPSLVLLDIMMPVVDGFQVLTWARERFSASQLSIIMITAKDQSEDIVKALQMGADDYVTKPIDFQVVVARMNNQLSRRQAEFALRESEERFALAARGANDGLWDWDRRTNQIFFSERWKNMLGYAAEEIGASIDEWFQRVHPDDLERLNQALKNHLEGRDEHFACEYRISLKDGSQRWMLSRGTSMRDASGNAYRMAGWQTDTSTRVEHDSLTALPNRGLLLDRVEHAVVRNHRPGEHGFGVFYVGIDRFRVINETLGHHIGDELLIGIARCLERLIRPGDTVSRLGGDEFCILVEDMDSVGSAIAFCNRLRSHLSEPILIEDKPLHVTASVGIALYKGGESNGGELLRMAHKAMDLAKQQKDTYRIYADDMSQDARSDLQLELLLRPALELGQIFLVYQPQIDARSGQIIGAEALIRWNCPELGMISPMRFIPLAEEIGLIVPIGEWVLRTACRQAVEWRKMGLGEVRMGVNLSSRQFKQPGLPDLVRAIIEETGIEPRLLDLELTESMLMEDTKRVIEELNALHKLGALLSIDDFGTGYSSLAYLKRFPLDTLKIDQSFVRELDTDQGDAAICTAIINMAHSLKLKVIAEGVEKQLHLEFLKARGCDEFQGYYFSKPIEPDAFAELLRQNRSWA